MSESKDVKYEDALKRLEKFVIGLAKFGAGKGELPDPETLSKSEVKARIFDIVAKLTHAPGNGAAIGGLKVVTANGWFAARPSGTEDIYKIYAESFRGREHLRRIQEEAQAMVTTAFKAAGAA